MDIPENNQQGYEAGSVALHVEKLPNEWVLCGCDLLKNLPSAAPLLNSTRMDEFWGGFILTHEAGCCFLQQAGASHLQPPLPVVEVLKIISVALNYFDCCQVVVQFLVCHVAASCSESLQSFLFGFSYSLSSHFQAKSFADPPWLFGWKCALFSHKLPGITVNPGWKTLPASGRGNKSEVGRLVKSRKIVFCSLPGVWEKVDAILPCVCFCCNMADSKCLVWLQGVTGRWHCDSFIASWCGLCLKAFTSRAPALKSGTFLLPWNCCCLTWLLAAEVAALLSRMAVHITAVKWEVGWVLYTSPGPPLSWWRLGTRWGTLVHAK